MRKFAFLCILMSIFLTNSCSSEHAQLTRAEPTPEEQLKSLLIGRWELEEEFDFGHYKPKIKSMYVFFQEGTVAHGEEVQWNGEGELPVMEYGNWQVIDEDKIKIVYPLKTWILLIITHSDNTISFNNWDIRGETAFNPNRYRKIE